MCSSLSASCPKITRNSFECIQSHTDFFDSSGFITSYTLRLSLLPGYKYSFANQYSRLCRTIFRFSFTIRSGRRIYRHSYSRRTKRAAATILQIWQELLRSGKNRPITQLSWLPIWTVWNMPKTSYLPMTGIPFI